MTEVTEKTGKSGSIKKGILISLLTLCGLVALLSLHGYRAYHDERVYFDGALSGIDRVSLAEIRGARPYPGDGEVQFYRNHVLSEEEKLVFDILEYALYNDKQYVRFSSKHAPKQPETFFTSIEKVLACLSLDSQFDLIYNLKEENLPTIGLYYSKTPWGRVTVDLKRLNALKYAAYEEALVYAGRVVEQMPAEYQSDYEKARYLYAYVVANIAYDSSERTAAPGGTVSRATAWDALVNGQAQCAGLANAVAMLYNLAGIECHKVMGHPTLAPDTGAVEDGGAEDGHMWNMTRIDGVYYQIDTTNAIGVKKEIDEARGESENLPAVLPAFGFCMSGRAMEWVDSYDKDRILFFESVGSVNDEQAPYIDDTMVVLFPEDLNDFAKDAAAALNRALEKGGPGGVVILLNAENEETTSAYLHKEGYFSAVARHLRPESEKRYGYIGYDKFCYLFVD